MMDFAAPAHRARPEAIVPMINVVFLLLIFFLMTAEIEPPDPVEVTPPLADAPMAERAINTLYIGADGELAYEQSTGGAVFASLSARDHAAPLAIRADAALEAQALARLLPRLAEVGVLDITLITLAAP